MGKNKKKKEKIIYYDDNSTISDMTNVTRTGKPRPKRSNTPPPTESKWKTYWNAVKSMFFPMCVVLFVLAVLFIILRLITG